MIGHGPDYSLGQALPSDVLVGGNAVWSRYRRYPVFSLRWLWARSALFAVIILFVAAVIGTGTGLATQDWWIGTQIGVAEFVAFTLMATMGPALATWVRHRRWPIAHERKAVVIAVLLGTLLLDEPFGPRVILAAALVFLGSAVVRWSAKRGKKIGTQNA